VAGDAGHAIVGIGETPYVRGSELTTTAMAAQASAIAMVDAGLKPTEVDGLLLFSYVNDPLDSYVLAPTLGITTLNWQLSVYGGSYNAVGMISLASAAIQAGLCKTVLALHVVQSFSVKRGHGRSGFPLREPFGGTFAAVQFALPAQRHMHEYGTNEDHFGAVAVAARKHAQLNPNALMKKPMTMEDHHASRMIASPFRMLDCCVQTDGAAAFIVSDTARARDLAQHPVRLLGGVANGNGPAADQANTVEEYTSMGLRSVAPRLWAKAGVKPSDMSFAQVYDAYTSMVIMQMEDLGFCGKGEGGPFVMDGRIELGGQLPVNTSGGHLSEGYMHGMGHINEAVRQLRHSYAGTPRQVANAQLGVVASGPTPASAVVLARG
jgi:acetyl-CoA acetyltransferase